MHNNNNNNNSNNNYYDNKMHQININDLFLSKKKRSVYFTDEMECLPIKITTCYIININI